MTYREKVLEELNAKVRDAAESLVNTLRLNNARAEAAPEASHEAAMLSGWLAGLGWIGRNARLITPGAGPRLVSAAVATDAPLPLTCAQPPTNQCGSCRRCVETCPAKALSGALFDKPAPLHTIVDPNLCVMLREKKRETCDLCVKACPYGQHGRILMAG